LDCTLLYVLLGKKQVLLGLWKTSSGEEKSKMIAFLSRDFTQQKWKESAVKNAYSLLGKQRYGSNRWLIR
jgi:hypothetical protein